MEGVIKKLHRDKQFGFIRAKHGGKEFFFHQSAVKNARFEDLEEGQDVIFEDADGPKGPRAEDIYI